jgi:ATP-dependent helicase HepA
MPVRFVQHPTYGTGRVVAGENFVRFFDGPGVEETILPLTSDLKTVELERRQRVWFEDAGRWLSGYADSLHAAGEAYLVDLTQGRTEYIAADRLRVRWTMPVVDPSIFLKAGTPDGNGLHNGRAAFVEDIICQRASAQGMAGIWSSAVELHAHQIGAARRVLSDPVKRYLLADEVGLGKTVEAGMVLRQLLMDNMGDVLVLVPDGLVSQWRGELSSKFRIDQHSGRVSIVGHSLVTSVAAVERLLVVVDEAHRLTATGTADSAYSALCTIAATTNCLLLLSATPVRSNEDGFLRMLHLLDPLTYPLGDAEKFRRRVEIRDDLAEALAAMGEETPVRFLSEPVEMLRRLLPEEPWLHRELDLLSSAVDRRDGDAARTIARTLRTKISETHRIHRRLIRTRRSASLAKLFPVRGRTTGMNWLLADPDSRREGVMRLVDDLRVELAGMDAVNQAGVLRTVLGRSMAPIIALADLAAALRGEGDHDLDSVEVAALDGIAGTMVGRQFAARIDEIVGGSTEADRFDAMIRWVWPHVGAHRVAVASSFPATAEAAAKRLEEQFGTGRVVRLLSTMSTDERTAAGRQFLADPSRSIIVIDRSSEEGLNLQVVEEVLHLDLPMSTARLEQRLGRFDRWAPRGITITSPVKSTVFREASDRLDAHLGAWRQVLDEAADIFGQSSATLQYVLPALEADFVEGCLDQDMATAADLLIARRDDLDAQRRRIEGQDLLDTIEERAGDQALADSMRSADRSLHILSNFRYYVVKTLKFTEDVGRDSTRFGISSKHPPRLSESQIHRIGPGNLRRRYANRRAAATGGIGLLRWGEPIVDRFFDLAMTDERGRAFAIEVRQPRSRPGSLLTFFGFTVIVSPNLAALEDLQVDDPSAGASAVARLGQQFPPLLETVWWHPDQGEPNDHIRGLLARASGHNLGADPERFHELTYGLDWPNLCDRAANDALRSVAHRQTVQAATAAAAAEAEAMRAYENAILQARLNTGAEPRPDLAVLDAVVAAVQDPQLTIDACGVVFITGPDR